MIKYIPSEEFEWLNNYIWHKEIIELLERNDCEIAHEYIHPNSPSIIFSYERNLQGSQFCWGISAKSSKGHRIQIKFDPRDGFQYGVDHSPIPVICIDNFVAHFEWELSLPPKEASND